MPLPSNSKATHSGFENQQHFEVAMSVPLPNRKSVNQNFKLKKKHKNKFDEYWIVFLFIAQSRKQTEDTNTSQCAVPMDFRRPNI